jgi:hypothetical protein
MFYTKRTISFITAIISLVIFALPVAADGGETDAYSGTYIDGPYVQTGSAHTPAVSSGETDAHANQPPGSVSDPSSESLAYIGGIGETDSYAGDPVESVHVQSGALVIAQPSSGETDAFAIEENVQAPASEYFVYLDGDGETDSHAGVGESSDFDPGVKLTRADISELEAGSTEVNDTQVLLAYAGETDQASGMETVEITGQLSNVYVLLRQPDTTPTVL